MSSEDLTLEDMQKVARSKRKAIRVQGIVNFFVNQLENKMNNGDNALISGVVTVDWPSNSTTPDATDLAVAVEQLRERLKCDVMPNKVTGTTRIQLTFEDKKRSEMQ